MRVTAYLAGIPQQNNNKEKANCLNFYIQGVNACGDQGIVNPTMQLDPCDVAVIQGFTHETGKQLPHLQLRNNVLQRQRETNGRTLIIDSNLFLYIPGKENGPYHYLRYSFDGVFKNTGFYFDTEIDPRRWQKIKRNYGIELKEYRTKGEHILVCLQRNGGWSMRGLPVMQWLEETIRKIKAFTDRPIVVRAHPGDKKAIAYLKVNHPNVRVSPIGKNIPIQHDLRHAWAVVTYNSSPGVASLIEGVPVFMTDPDPNYSQYGEVANTTLKRLENPKLHDRQNWIERISMFHWSFPETQSGEAWAHMRNYVRQ